MKKRRLKKWVKNALLIIFSIIIYNITKININIYILMISWFYLLFIMPTILYFINTNEK